MMRSIFLITLALLLHATNASAEKEERWWGHCPGPACPAEKPEPSRNSSESALGGRAHTPDRTYKNMGREELDKERDDHERAIKEIEKEKRRRDAAR